MEGRHIMQQDYVPVGAEIAFPGPAHIPVLKINEIYSVQYTEIVPRSKIQHIYHTLNIVGTLGGFLIRSHGKCSESRVGNATQRKK